MQYTVYGYRQDGRGTERNFLVEATDAICARAVFLVDWPGWEPKVAMPARCFAGGEHSGELSVWQGQDKTAILCQYHGLNPPNRLPSKQPLFQS